MPRRKKSSQSPARVPGGQLVEESLGQGYPLDMESDFPPSKEGYDRQNISRNMREMFCHLDPEVVHMVLAECRFKAESAMDALLEMSIAAELSAPVISPVSGFERTAAALLSPSPVAQPVLDSSSDHVTSPLSTSILTEELDFQVEQELQKLTAQQSSLPPSQQVFPELPHLDQEPQSGWGLVPSRASSPIELPGTKAQNSTVDFPLLKPKEPTDRSQASLRLASAGHPSAFQMYKKNESHVNSDNSVRGAPMPAPPWNLHPPFFSPCLYGTQRPCFITPAAPPNWPRQVGHPYAWRYQAPLRPPAAIPTSRTMASGAVPAQPYAHLARLRLEGRVLVLLRGAPGSGKSTLARAFLEHNRGGVVLSTDDYFTCEGRYQFDPTALGEAHEWNHQRAKEAFERGANPIIIDNTNMQGWEMKPYVAQALKHHFKVLFREPDTWWRHKPRELQRRCKKNVPVETIRRMLDGYERFVSVQSIMCSLIPERKQRLQLTNRNVQCVTPDAKCPDLVSEPGMTMKNCRPHHYSSLPDVSSISHVCEVGKLADNRTSTDLLNFQPIATSVVNSEHSDKDDDLDLAALDSELDALNLPGGDQTISNCIVESVTNHARDDISEGFSESVKKRVQRPGEEWDLFERHSADLVKDINQSDVLATGTERKKGEDESAVGRDDGDDSKVFYFGGDWPSEGSLEQRQVRRKERDGASDDKDLSKQVNKDMDKGKAGPDLTEFQKLLNLIQTGVVTCQSGSSCSSPLSLCNGLELDAADKIKEAIGCKPESKESLLNLNTDKSNKGDSSACLLERTTADCKKNGEEILKNETTGCERTENSLWAMDTEKKESKDTEHEDNGNNCRDQGGVEATLPLDTSHPRDSCRASEGSCVLIGDTQGERPRQGRRSGKLCKLALTFTHNCPAPSLNTPENPSSITLPDCVTGFNPKPDLSAKPKEDVHPRPTTPLSPDGGCPTQTEPQDFALLWRLNRPDHPPDTAVGEFTVLCANSSRFVPELASAVSAAVAVHPSTRNIVPDRVVHEKSTQVEDGEFGAYQSRLEGLGILSRHFKLLPFETLEDLYDKCQQDLEWTTNLLLDSGEKLFRDEDVLEEDVAHVKLEEPTTPLEKTLETQEGDECSVEPPGHILQPSACETLGGTSDTDLSLGGAVSPSQLDVLSHNPSLPALDKDEDKEAMEESSVETADDIASMDEVHRLLQAELEELEREERQKKEERGGVAERGSSVLNIQSLELKIPTELALQLTELFGPVGVEPGTSSSDDYAVQMDMNFAKLLHQKWKETIQERQRQATLSRHLLRNTPWGEPHLGKTTSPFLSGTDADGRADQPYTDHWNFSQPRVSLRNIIKEELALQKNMEKSRRSRADLSRRDGASVLKEEQLYSRFPTIDRHFLQEIFRDHNHCLSQTELFINSIMDQEPARTVVAPEPPKSDHLRTASKEREKKLVDSALPFYQNYQDTEDPQYEDFRAEASLQRSRQLESFAKAAEAYKQGRREVASFYAQQGQLHGQRMREANERAEVQIFERVNSSLLPNNILDLHGLHVDEALRHLGRVLRDKTAECEQGLCRPQLSVITGRGNHSQGGVARIRPAVLNYLANTHYRFTEPKPGLVLVSLK
ncbi:NEDD4-binding protein 2 [Nerophis ophidion]|uniref:NEDD4-binding protein 2 n=1 Tax=Nerophis ophidion TaxID=159077 RepID=UPI002AE01676|nr:NEDD4-binding protein 2 [Nerophis ophidion]